MKFSARSIFSLGSALSVLLLACAGCKAPAVKPRLDSDLATEKVPALIQQGMQGENADFPALVAALDDDDSAVRLFAARTLEELTGQTFDYRYYQSRHQRRPAMDRWRAWLDDPDGASP